MAHYSYSAPKNSKTNLKSSLLEVKNQIGLFYQKEYITKLSELNLKYYPY